MTELLILNFLIVGIILISNYLLQKKINSKTDSADQLLNSITNNFDRVEKSIKDEFSRTRNEFSNSQKEARQELTNAVNNFTDSISKRISETSQMQKNQLEFFSNQLQKFSQANEIRFESLQKQISDNLNLMRENNEKKLEEMRITVDEKLHETLEKRLGESFKLVSERLEIVHKGLGEMQTLASGVGDLKRVLTNVKTRGTWGEIQLENLIGQILAPDQFSRNVEVKKGSGQRVDFAVKLPGKNDSPEDVVWMPIDAKFPLEDYQRLIDSQEQANPILIEESSKEIEKRVKENAKSISSKYINPPATTDFAIMFLPIEGLYAEVIRRPGLADTLQRDFRIIIAGPTNIAALLNSLQMGFKTLVIEKRSSEVWKLLGVVKSEFGKFGDILEKTQLKLDQASKTIGDATKKTRTIERKLRGVEELPAADSNLFLEK